MSGIDRRTLLAASVGSLAGPPASAAAPGPAASPDRASEAPPPPVTAIIARYAVSATPDALPVPVRHAATRTLLNWVGCAVGGSREPAPRRAFAALAPFAGPPEASLFGRPERTDALHAALINGISSHVLDFDDTHLRTIIHPAGPVAAALCGFSEHRPVDGATFMTALALGCELECRIGNAVYPEHYAMGWHITGTTGVFGAAAAVGHVLRLDPDRMQSAIGIAASQPVGLKVQFGTDTKSFHPGRAAQNGLVSALLAEQGFTASPVAIEGRDGWGQALSTRHDWTRITDGLGEQFELERNTFKPFACGIVSHPAIDAAIRIRSANRPAPGSIRAVALTANPLVLSLMGKTNPQTGLEGKFSIFHAVAVALNTGRAGEQAFTDAAVRDPATVAVRRTVTVTTDPAMPTDAAELAVTLADGRVLRQRVDHAVGSEANPMTDAQLAEKFSGLADGILPPDRARTLADLCWSAWSLPDAAAIPCAGAAPT